MQLTFLPLHNKFLNAIKWNSIESIAYNVIFMIHQIALYRILGYVTFGAIGAFFSLIYLSIGIFNFGFDTSLAYYFRFIGTDKKSALRFLLQCVIPQLFIYIAFPLIILTVLHYYNSLFFIFSKIPGNNSIYFILLGILLYLSEGLKKSLKCFLDLAFQNKPIAILEITHITLYISTIWFSYYCGLPINLYILVAPLVMISLFPHTMVPAIAKRI